MGLRQIIWDNSSTPFRNRSRLLPGCILLAFAVQQIYLPAPNAATDRINARGVTPIDSHPVTVAWQCNWRSIGSELARGGLSAGGRLPEIRLCDTLGHVDDVVGFHHGGG